MAIGPGAVDPKSLNVLGATQPEIYRDTVDDMVRAIQADAVLFWQQSFQTDGPIDIWEINGERYLSNGNHRFQAALAAGVDIPADMIVVTDKTGSAVPTFRFDQMTWLPGRK